VVESIMHPPMEEFNVLTVLLIPPCATPKVVAQVNRLKRISEDTSIWQAIIRFNYSHLLENLTVSTILLTLPSVTPRDVVKVNRFN
jgi:hypothetical protein